MKAIVRNLLPDDYVGFTLYLRIFIVSILIIGGICTIFNKSTRDELLNSKHLEDTTISVHK